MNTDPEEIKHKKIRQNYKFDTFLMYLIQDVTKRTSADILNFFHELATQVCEIGLKNMLGRGIDKKITDYFPNTTIPFFMRVKGRLGYYEQRHIKDEAEEIFGCNVEVCFPDKVTYIKEDLLDDISVQLMEKALLGGEEVDMAPFPKPDISTPKMYRDLMDAFAGRPAKISKRKTKKDSQ